MFVLRYLTICISRDVIKAVIGFTDTIKSHALLNLQFNPYEMASLGHLIGIYKQ